MRNIVLFTATGAGSGYLPGAPGTAGAGVGVALYLLLLQLPLPLPPGWTAALAFAAIAIAGIWAAGRAERFLGRHDDPRITIDEVAGMLAALLFLPPRPEVIAFAFLSFRALDILKPWPVRRAERLPGGLGVMADDLLAGAAANLAGQLLWRLAWRGAMP
jgi:phosphatidylglycerophosphatase A